MIDHWHIADLYQTFNLPMPRVIECDSPLQAVLIGEITNNEKVNHQFQLESSRYIIGRSISFVEHKLKSLLGYIDREVMNIL